MCVDLVYAAIWFFTENHTVACGNASLSLKMPWYPVFHGNNEISLTKVQNILTGFYGLVEIKNRQYDISAI
jgi:hypothetical protein